jgi:hypothetical protein
MKWIKLPSCDDEILRKLNSIKGIHKATNGLAIGYYLLLPVVKEKRRRKHGKFRNIPKISG